MSATPILPVDKPPGVWELLVNGIVHENPVFRLALSLCPAVAVTTTVANGIILGIAVLAVQVLSSVTVALTRSLIHPRVRIPVYTIIIAVWVSAIDMALAAFAPALYAQVGLYVKLIVAFAIIISRLEADHLVQRLAPVRGKVGQPSVPMALNPDGAFSIGIKIGRRSMDMLLVDFCGHPRERLSLSYPFPDPDTLFGDVPMDLRFRGRQRTALPADGGWGHGFDAGAVFVVGALEIGLAGNDLATSIDWKVEESITAKDSLSGDYVTQTVGEQLPFTSTVPASYVLTAMTRLGGVLVAADVQRDALEQISGHAGAELWAGPLALRAGASLDVQQRTQFAGGIGLRLGRLGLDVAVATNQANLTHERAVDLGIGLSFYPARTR